MSYKVTAPLVIIANADGKSGDWYGYVDAIVPAHLNDERCKQLAKEGMLEKVSEAAADPSVEPSGPPAKSASKGDWEQYARSQGASDNDLDGKTKDDLIAAYGDGS